MITYHKASNEADLDEIQRLRFRVFCQERVIDTESYRPMELECDFLDRYSIHFIARHFDLVPVGTLRLVRANPHGFPVERLCPLDAGTIDRIAELSKIAISKLGLKISGARRQDVFMGLLGEAYRESLRLDIGYWYAVLSPATHKRFKKYGLPFIDIKTPSDRTARQAPYMIDLRDLHKLFPCTVPKAREGMPARSGMPAHRRQRECPSNH